MSDIVNDLRNPPVDGLPPKKANAFLLCLCSDAADEITRLREQVAALEADRDDWIACHAKIFRELQETKTLVGNKCEEVAALAEQNEKMRTALEAVSEFRFPHGDNCYLDPDHAYGNSCLCGKESLESLVAEALSIPDLATPALNRIKREGRCVGLLEAAEICEEYQGSAETCADAIRARADERYPDESREMKP